jgi:hypothetical protein
MHERIIIIYCISVVLFHGISKSFKNKITNKQYVMKGQPIEAKPLKAASSADREGQFMVCAKGAGQRMLDDGVC